MTLLLKRIDKRDDGVLSSLSKADDGTRIATTIEHSYPTDFGDGSYDAKLKPGTYECIRGMHKLKVNSPSFETFEITGVKGHKGILFHCGNWHTDSDGCVLLGSGYGGDPRMIYNSRKTFSEFMYLLSGVDSFKLIVEDV